MCELVSMGREVRVTETSHFSRSFGRYVPVKFIHKSKKLLLMNSMVENGNDTSFPIKYSSFTQVKIRDASTLGNINK